MATLPIMLGGTLVSGLLNGIFGGKAATELAAGQLTAANNANSIRDNQYQLTRSDLTPYTNTGQDAITTLGNLLGIGPKPGSGTATATPAVSQDASGKQGLLTFLQDWMAGKNPVGADGKHIGSAPSNAATRAKVQGQIDQLQRDITTAGQISDNATRQQQTIDSQDPNQYGSLMKDFTAADFDINKDPGAQYRMEEANKAIERSAAARGGVQSGGTLKALQTNSEDLASQEFQNAYNRFDNNRKTKANLLLGTAGLGQVSLGQQANLGANVATQDANSTAGGITGAADARASGYVNTANTVNSTIGSLLDLYNLYKKGGGSTSGSSGVPGSSGQIYSTPPFIPSATSNGSIRAPQLRLN